MWKITPEFGKLHKKDNFLHLPVFKILPKPILHFGNHFFLLIHVWLAKCYEDSFGDIQSKHLKGQLWPRVSNVFAYSCPAPLPGQLWPRVSNVFVYSCPAPLPGQLWPRISDVFHGFGWVFMVPGWFFMVFLQNVPAPNCILARQSSLGPPPGGRHRT